MVRELTEDNFDTVLAKTDGLILVDFWAAWCGPCRVLGKILEELSEESDENRHFFKLNVDEQQTIAERYNIHSLPTVLVFENGEIKNSLVGVRPKEMYKEILL